MTRWEDAQCNPKNKTPRVCACRLPRQQPNNFRVDHRHPPEPKCECGGLIRPDPIRRHDPISRPREPNYSTLTYPPVIHHTTVIIHPRPSTRHSSFFAPSIPRLSEPSYKVCYCNPYKQNLPWTGGYSHGHQCTCHGRTRASRKDREDREKQERLRRDYDSYLDCRIPHTVVSRERRGRYSHYVG
jgi:hypothetical protein